MSGTHTDAQLLLATQIAYLNIRVDKGDEPVNVKQWIEEARCNLVNSNDPLAQKQLETIDHILDMTKNPEFADLGWEKWSVVDCCDHNSGYDATGMYASLIDTGDGNAIVGFRGSESYDAEQNYRDWLEGDLNLLNNPLTEQQADAEAYMNEIMEEYGDDYNSFDVTGHSLGGNLAEHATIMTQTDKIGRCVNFDGPGFSTEYIKAHEKQIRENGGKVDHYAWSFVGGMLFPLGGTNYQVIDATGSGPTRHDTKNVLLDNGHVTPGDRDSLADVFFWASKGTDMAPSKVGENITSILIPAGITITGLIAAIGKISDWFSGTWDKLFPADAEFDVALPVLFDASEELGKLSNEVNDYIKDVRSLADGLQYVSLSGHLFKHRFHRIARNLEKDAAALQDMQNALRRCGDQYQGADAETERELTI